MSTVIPHPTAATTETARRGRVTRLVLGTVAVLVALALIGCAIAAVAGLETNRDSTGYFVTHAHRYQSSSYALSTESLKVGGVTGVLGAALVRLRITVTSHDAAKPIFVGIARTQDADRYLAGVQHDELRDIKFDPFTIDYHRSGSGAPATPPAAQTFWTRSTTGAGRQTISWPVKGGRWTAVVMNADGSRNVSVHAQLAARLSGAWWFVVAFLAIGGAALVGGAVLVRSGLRRQASEPVTSEGSR